MFQSYSKLNENKNPVKKDKDYLRGQKVSIPKNKFRHNTYFQNTFFMIK